MKNLIPIPENMDSLRTACLEFENELNKLSKDEQIVALWSLMSPSERYQALLKFRYDIGILALNMARKLCEVKNGRESNTDTRTDFGTDTLSHSDS